jgi:hypothetical protein
MLRTYLLAAALLSLTIPGGMAEQARTGSWDGERMRLTPRPQLPTFADELRGNCAGLTVTVRTRIEWLKALEGKDSQQQWPPPAPWVAWSRRPLGGGIARQRERIARLNAALGAKGCQTVDVNAELRRAPAVRTKRK